MTPQTTLQRFAASVRALDVEGLVACYEPTAVQIPAPEIRLEGHAALREGFRQTLAIRPELDLTPVEISIVGDLAYVANEYALRGTAPDGTRIERQGRSAIVMRRQPSGEWLMVIDRL